MSENERQPAALHRRSEFRAVVAAWRENLAVACSGGVDSTALLILATAARDRQRIDPFVCIHVDHRVRPESSGEADVVAATCRTLDVPFVRIDVDRCEECSQGAPEDVLRIARYRVIARAVRQLGLSGVVTAHQRDDQVETILMRLLTGAGPSAVSGMQPTQSLAFNDTQVSIVRPLLSSRRRALERIVQQSGFAIVDDPTNSDVSIPRNRLRHRVIPELSAAFPGFESAFLRAANLATLDAEYVDAVASQEVNRVVGYRQGGVLIDRDWVKSVHPALANRIIRSAILSLLQHQSTETRREVTHERVESVRAASAGRTGARIELPGRVTAVIGKHTLEISTEGRTEHDAGT